MNVTPEQFRQARALLGWARQDLAQRSGVSIETIDRVESAGSFFNGKQRTVRKLQAAYEAAGVEFTSNGLPGIGLRKRGE